MKIIKVRIQRAEGKISQCDGWHEFTGADIERRANAYLAEISRTAPRDGSYHKTDVELTFENGETVKDVFAVKHPSTFNSDTNIRRHFGI